ncbi:hypothetical protein [Natronomonas sp. EA1]|uniref:hypothetical protein n=1 Tax=Natronomonas sp. EA1 TaxID=3421655 RepID=UPI003EBA3026
MQLHHLAPVLFACWLVYGAVVQPVIAGLLLVALVPALLVVAPLVAVRVVSAEPVRVPRQVCVGGVCVRVERRAAVE